MYSRADVILRGGSTRRGRNSSTVGKTFTTGRPTPTEKAQEKTRLKKLLLEPGRRFAPSRSFSSGPGVAQNAAQPAIAQESTKEKNLMQVLEK